VISRHRVNHPFPSLDSHPRHKAEGNLEGSNQKQPAS
jgi:hypothetical protein